MTIEEFKTLDFNQQIGYTFQFEVFGSWDDEDYNEYNNDGSTLFRVDNFLVLVSYNGQGQIVKVEAMNSILDLDNRKNVFDSNP